jgi:hypothetical protein
MIKLDKLRHVANFSRTLKNKANVSSMWHTAQQAAHKGSFSTPIGTYDRVDAGTCHVQSDVFQNGLRA